jgi:hypothetical protein
LKSGIIGLPTTAVMDSCLGIAPLLSSPQTVESLREAFNSAD